MKPDADPAGCAIGLALLVLSGLAFLLALALAVIFITAGR